LKSFFHESEPVSINIDQSPLIIKQIENNYLKLQIL